MRRFFDPTAAEGGERRARIRAAMLFIETYRELPLLAWPEWLNQLSLFWAFGSPYSGWPSVGRLVTLLVVAAGGLAGAVAVAERSSSVP